jgi:hypothetical protein
MVTLTNEEFDALEPAEQKAHLASEEKIVFGHDFHKTKGVPVEQGIGSAGRENLNHFNAIRKYEGEEAYQAALENTHKKYPERAAKLNLPKPKPKPVPPVATKAP